MQTLEAGRGSRRRRRYLAPGAAALLALLLILGLIVLPRRGSSPPSSARPATGAPVDGISCGGEVFALHQHARLEIWIDGQPATVPAGIGVVEPTRVRFGSIETARCFYWLHTHDSSGTVHIEAPVPRPFTLGQFFDLWGEPISTDGVLGRTGTLVASVDGRPNSGDPRTIPLTDGEEIRLDLQSGSSPLAWLRSHLP